MSAKKKILVLTPRFPYPVVGGDRLRIYKVCEALAAQYDLTLLSLCETREEMNMPIPDDGVFRQVERVYLSKSRSRINTLLTIPTRYPLQIGYYRSKEFRRRVQELEPQHDALLSHLIRCVEYIKDFEKPRILEMTDAISLNYKRVSELDARIGPKAKVYSFEAKRLMKYERSILDSVDLSILVSETDKKFLENGTDRPDVLVASNGVAFEKLPFKDRRSCKPIIAFIGNMTSVQNLDACVYFAERILPLIRQEIDATFKVVGRIGDDGRARLDRFENVQVTGQVSSIPEATADAKIGVCPVRMAAGVQNKVLEYMSLGLPVVTSGIGLEGLGAVAERDLLVGNTPEEFCTQIIKILNDSDLLRELSLNGRQYVQSSHNWSTCLQQIVLKTQQILETEQEIK